MDRKRSNNFNDKSASYHNQSRSDDRPRHSYPYQPYHGASTDNRYDRPFSSYRGSEPRSHKENHDKSLRDDGRSWKNSEYSNRRNNSMKNDYEGDRKHDDDWGRRDRQSSHASNKSRSKSAGAEKDTELHQRTNHDSKNCHSFKEPLSRSNHKVSQDKIPFRKKSDSNYQRPTGNENYDHSTCPRYSTSTRDSNTFQAQNDRAYNRPFSESMRGKSKWTSGNDNLSLKNQGDFDSCHQVSQKRDDDWGRVSERNVTNSGISHSGRLQHGKDCSNDTVEEKYKESLKTSVSECPNFSQENNLFGESTLQRNHQTLQKDLPHHKCSDEGGLNTMGYGVSVQSSNESHFSSCNYSDTHKRSNDHLHKVSNAASLHMAEHDLLPLESNAKQGRFETIDLTDEQDCPSPKLNEGTNFYGHKDFNSSSRNSRSVSTRPNYHCYAQPPPIQTHQTIQTGSSTQVYSENEELLREIERKELEIKAAKVELELKRLRQKLHHESTHANRVNDSNSSNFNEKMSSNSKPESHDRMRFESSHRSYLSDDDDSIFTPDSGTNHHSKNNDMSSSNISPRNLGFKTQPNDSSPCVTKKSLKKKAAKNNFCTDNNKRTKYSVSSKSIDSLDQDEEDQNRQRSSADNKKGEKKQSCKRNTIHSKSTISSRSMSPAEQDKKKLGTKKKPKKSKNEYTEKILMSQYTPRIIDHYLNPDYSIDGNKFLVKWISNNESDKQNYSNQTENECSSWIRHENFLFPSLAQRYLSDKVKVMKTNNEMIQRLRKWRVKCKDQESGVKAINTFDEDGDDMYGVDFCCFLCKCPWNKELKHNIRIGDIGLTSHRGCCHGYSNVSDLENFVSPAAKVLMENEDTEYSMNAPADSISQDIGKEVSPTLFVTSSDDVLFSKGEENNFEFCREIRANVLPREERAAVVLSINVGLGGVAVALKQLKLKTKRIIYVENDLVSQHVIRFHHDSTYGETSDHDGIEHIIGLFDTFDDIKANPHEMVKKFGPIDVIICVCPRGKTNEENMQFATEFFTLVDNIKSLNTDLHPEYDFMFYLLKTTAKIKEHIDIPDVSSCTCDSNVNDRSDDFAYVCNWSMVTVQTSLEKLASTKFGTDELDIVLGFPQDYAYHSVKCLFEVLKSALFLGFEGKKWREEIHPKYWNFLTLGPSGYDIKAKPNCNDFGMDSFSLLLKNPETSRILCDVDYAENLLRQSTSVKWLVTLLQPLRDLFSEKEYAGWEYSTPELTDCRPLVGDDSNISTINITGSFQHIDNASCNTYDRECHDHGEDGNQDSNHISNSSSARIESYDGIECVIQNRSSVKKEAHYDASTDDEGCTQKEECKSTEL